MATAGQIYPPGGTYYYQVWYRNGASTFCTPHNTFNISGALSIFWY